MKDSDGDGLLDSREQKIGTLLTNDDTDDDGLTDEEELANGLDATSKDTDENNILDHDEQETATSSLDSDIDNDGLPDGVELRGWHIPIFKTTGAVLKEIGIVESEPTVERDRVHITTNLFDNK